METHKDGDLEIWRHINETWKPGEIEKWKHGDMESWTHGHMETWRHGVMDTRTREAWTYGGH
jgi:hypothetical protein